MNKELCFLVKDLMPSYIDGITSKETTELISDHIKKCDSCNTYYKNMSIPIENDGDMNIKKMDFLKKYKRVLSGIILTTSIIVIILSIGIIYFAWVAFTGGNPTIENDVSRYGQYNNFLGYSNLEVFPNKIPNKSNKGYNDYYYYCKDTFLDPTCQVYASVNYTETEYNNEVKRLSEITQKLDNKINKIKYYNKGFCYPAYVAVNGNCNCYEYALLVENEHKIIYIFIQNVRKDEVIFNVNYLPENYLNNDQFNDFSIYAFDNGRKNEKTMVYGKLRNKNS